MLPFLKPRSMPTVMVHKIEDGQLKPEGLEGEKDPGLMSAMEDLIKAIGEKDASKMADAFEAAFDMCESRDPQDMGGEL